MAKLHEVVPIRGPGASMPFIVTSSLEKVDPTTRRLIRSHVMRGKKQQQCRNVKNRRLSGRVSPSAQTLKRRIGFEELSEMYRSLIPSRVGSDLSFIDFADEIETSILLNMTKVSNYATRIIFPLIGAIGYQPDKKDWLGLISLDSAALHITAFTVEEFVDKMLRGRWDGTNVVAMSHFQKGLHLLRERLLGHDDDYKIADSTIGVVTKLATAAHFNGDFTTSKQHLEGIRRMVDLRGGLEVFEANYLLVDMLRCDLGLALLNCSDHVFYRQNEQPVIKYPEKVLPAANDKMHSQASTELAENMNDELALAWRVMTKFCSLVNLGTQTQRLVRPEIIHETMTALMYRLLDMDFAAGTIDEAVRQGLLAFSYHVFLQWQDIRPPYHPFPLMYKTCLLDLQLMDGVPPTLMLWLLMTAAHSIFNTRDERWLMEGLRKYINSCQAREWKDMRDILKTYMWISLLDDESGKEIFDVLIQENRIH